MKSLISEYPSDDWVQMIAVSMAKSSDPTDLIQVAVADAVIGRERSSSGGLNTRTMLARLADGLTVDNVADRVKMVTAKTQRLARSERMRSVVLDIAALPTEGDDLDEPVLILAQHLTRMIPRLRSLGMSTTDLLGMVDRIPGEMGERIICQVLAGAEDVDRAAKIDHIERRMASQTATGDDRDLIDDILTTPLPAAELERWQATFGKPSPPPDPAAGSDVIGDNWARAWR